jgi:hypothetical protein
MLRILSLLLPILFLSACASNIEVKDFGPYWEKGIVDPAFLGWWKEPVDKDPLKFRVMNRAATYQIAVMDTNGWEIQEAEQQARTLQTGNYLFLMQKVPDRHDRWVPSSMHRYKIDGDKIREYTLNAKKMREFLAKNYSTEKNIDTVLCKKTGKLGCVDHTEIHKLDENVYKILGSIPDTKAFWTHEKNSLQKMR